MMPRMLEELYYGNINPNALGARIIIEVMRENDGVLRDIVE